MGGLQEPIRNQVRLLDPQELMDTMRMARDGEALHGGPKTGGTGRSVLNWSRPMGSMSRVEPVRQNPERVGSTGSSSLVRQELTQTSGTTSNNIENKGRSFRNLPYAEYMKLREEGKCFRCGGPFGPGHQCPERGLRMLILVEDKEEMDEVLKHAGVFHDQKGCHPRDIWHTKYP